MYLSFFPNERPILPKGKGTDNSVYNNMTKHHFVYYMIGEICDLGVEDVYKIEGGSREGYTMELKVAGKREKVKITAEDFSINPYLLAKKLITQIQKGSEVNVENYRDGC